MPRDISSSESAAWAVDNKAEKKNKKPSMAPLTDSQFDYKNRRLAAEAKSIDATSVHEWDRIIVSHRRVASRRDVT